MFNVSIDWLTRCTRRTKSRCIMHMFRFDHLGTIMINRRGGVRLSDIFIRILRILVWVPIHVDETLTHSHEKQPTAKWDPQAEDYEWSLCVDEPVMLTTVWHVCMITQQWRRSQKCTRSTVGAVTPSVRGSCIITGEWTDHSLQEIARNIRNTMVHALYLQFSKLTFQ